MIESDVASYYAQKLALHGATAKGVDWNGEESQLLRFAQLAKLIDTDNFSINDLGCGYGAFYDYLAQRFDKPTYFGYDVSPEMIDAARSRYVGSSTVQFDVSGRPHTVADYSVASGIFNVKLDYTNDVWANYVFEVLDHMNSFSRLGFAFNALTSYSDTEKMKSNLYYCNPETMFKHCKTVFSKQIALLHDYKLFEFTIIVRK